MACHDAAPPLTTTSRQERLLQLAMKSHHMLEGAGPHLHLVQCNGVNVLPRHIHSANLTVQCICGYILLLQQHPPTVSASRSPRPWQQRLKHTLDASAAYGKLSEKQSISINRAVPLRQEVSEIMHDHHSFPYHLPKHHRQMQARLNSTELAQYAGALKTSSSPSEVNQHQQCP